MTELWLTTRDWLMDNPAWIYGLIFGLAALEAVAIIGSIIPAVPMMVGLTLLAGSAGLDLPTVLLVAVLGAMLGDGISYVIGHHFKHRIDGWWPFRTHPDWLANAEGYVERHGGKSLIIGRFVGPIRAFVPMAAGIFQMPVRRFLWYNFVSAVLWAPPNILPGYIAGAAVTHPLMPGKHQLLFVSVILVTVALMAWLLPRLSAITRKWRQGHAPRNQGLFRASDNHPENQLMTLIVGLLAFDLGVLHRDGHEIGVKESLLLSGFYITLGLGFGGFVWWQLGETAAINYVTGKPTGSDGAYDTVKQAELGLKHYDKALAAVAKLRLGAQSRHVFLCVGGKCAPAEQGLASWEHLKRRLREAGLQGARVVLTGGGANSAAWRQLIADLFQLPVEVPVQAEGAAFGAALQAAWACAGASMPLADLVDAHVVFDPALSAQPDPVRGAAYARGYQRFNHYLQASLPLYRQRQP